MGRINKTIDGAFIDIVGTENKLSLYHQFLNQGAKKNASKRLTKVTDKYKSLISKNEILFENLATLEETIIQMRILEEMEIKLSRVKDYIYARCSFYRRDKQSNTINVLIKSVDLIPNFNGDISTLLEDKSFMRLCKKKLSENIEKEIQNNLKLLHLSGCITGETLGTAES